MSYKVERATNWEQVEEAATIALRCIKPSPDVDNTLPGKNWERARETWYALGPDVVYFIISEGPYQGKVLGYVRLFQCSPINYRTNPTWVVDHIWPMDPEALVMVDDVLPGKIFVKHFFSQHPLIRRWPRIGMAIAVPDAPYKIQSSYFSEWMLVLP